jgi:hypothetical protein
MTKELIPQHEALLAARLDADEIGRKAVTAAVLKMLEEDRRLAYAQRQPHVAVSASVAIAKLFDLFDYRPVNTVQVILSNADAGLL